MLTPEMRASLEAAAHTIAEQVLAIDAKAKSQRRSMTSDEEATVQNLNAALSNIDAQIAGYLPQPTERTELGNEMRETVEMQNVGESRGRQTLPNQRIMNGGLKQGVDDDLIGSNGTRTRSPRVIEGSAPRTYAAMFGKAANDRGGFKDLHEYMSVLYANTTDPRMIHAATAHVTFEGEKGGWMVPGALIGGLLDMSLEGEVIRPAASVVPLTTKSAEVPSWNYSDNSTAIGGFVGHWVGEGATISDQTGLVRRLSLQARKLIISSKMTSELMEDSVLFQSEFVQALSRAIGFYLDESFLIGDGVAKPRGILEDDALITVDANSGQSADTIEYSNLVNMFGRLHPSSVSGSVWLINPSVVPQLLTLSVPVTSGEQFYPALNESNGQFRLLSRPVILTEKCPALGEVGDVLLCDRSQYLIAMRREVTMQRSADAYWSTDEVGVRVRLRADGIGKWEAPVTPRNGPTLSWCVALEAR